MNKHLISLSFLLLPLLSSAGQIQLTATQLENVSLTTTKVMVREGVLQLKLNGILAADQRKTYRVAPVIDGVVTSLNVVAHDRVSKGQVLATLISNSLGQAQANYLEALARFELTQSERVRIKDLWQEGIVAESRWLKVDSEYKSARATLNSRQRLLSLTGLSKAQIQQLIKQPNRLAKFELISPINGVITAVDIESGQRLNEGQAAFHVDDLSTLWAMVNIPVASLAQVKIGSETEIRVQATPNKHYLGTLESLSSEVEAQSQTVTGRIVLDNSEGTLRPGMYAEISIANETTEALMVPASAVFNMGEKNYVFQVVDKDSFESIAVELGHNTGDWIAIISGINENAVIVSSGVAELKSHLQYQGGE